MKGMQRIDFYAYKQLDGRHAASTCVAYIWDVSSSDSAWFCLGGVFTAGVWNLAIPYGGEG